MLNEKEMRSKLFRKCVKELRERERKENLMPWKKKSNSRCKKAFNQGYKFKSVKCC